MVPEASLRRTDAGLVPAGEGWFVLNAADAVWEEHPVMGAAVAFDTRAVQFPDFGLNIHVLQPGQPNCMYHGENEQEDFLVLAGECLLLVEGEERRLRRWDLVHCPAWTQHVFVGAGDGPCAILMVGGRRNEGVVYPVEPVALEHGAGVEEETRVAKEAYARFGPWADRPYRSGDLPESGYSDLR